VDVLVVYYLLGQVTGHSPVKACDSCSVESQSNHDAHGNIAPRW